MPDSQGSAFEAVRQKLNSIVTKYEGRGLKRSPSDGEGDFTLIGPPTDASRRREVWFGGVQTRKRYVSYHLMPVYVFPELLDDVSAELKKRMQGKSCFNFTRVDQRLFHELAQLTEKGYQLFVDARLIVRSVESGEVSDTGSKPIS
jgi:hypothetical protein